MRVVTAVQVERERYMALGRHGEGKHEGAGDVAMATSSARARDIEPTAGRWLAHHLGQLGAQPLVVGTEFYALLIEQRAGALVSDDLPLAPPGACRSDSPCLDACSRIAST